MRDRKSGRVSQQDTHNFFDISKSFAIYPDKISSGSGETQGRPMWAPPKFSKDGQGPLRPPARPTGCPHSQGLLEANPKHDPTISFINIEMHSFKAFRDRNDMTLLDS